MQNPRIFAKSLGACLLPATMLLASLGTVACHPDHPAEPDPCQGVKAPTLTMRFVERLGTPTPDTAYNGAPMSLQAPGAPYTNYEWLIGTTYSRTGRNVAINFDNQTFGPIPVRLIARRPRNTACFPKDDGVDTLTQVLTLVDRRVVQSPLYGKFQGANSDTPRDTFTVRIYTGPSFYFPNNPLAGDDDYVVGIPKGCQYPYHAVGMTWRGFTASGGSGCSSFDITKGYLTARDSIRVEYRTQVTPTIIDKVFLGKRVR